MYVYIHTEKSERRKSSFSPKRELASLLKRMCGKSRMSGCTDYYTRGEPGL